MDINNEYGNRTRHEHLLIMLKDFNSFCNKNSIKYSLGGGTALGAVREHGFILWDDDADVMMDRENYNKFLDLKDTFAGYTTEKELWIIRIRKNDCEDKSATLDLFVFDKASDNKIDNAKRMFLLRTLQGMLKEDLHLKDFPIKYKVLLVGTKVLGLLIPKETKLSLYEKASIINNNEKTKTISCSNDLYKLLRNRYSADMLEEIISVKFEDTNLLLTKKYDEYLTTMYGDYMTPRNRSIENIYPTI